MAVGGGGEGEERKITPQFEMLKSWESDNEFFSNVYRKCIFFSEII